MSAVRVCVCISAHRELVRARNPSLGFGEPRDLQSKSSQTAEPRLGPALLLPDIHCFPVAVFPTMTRKQRPLVFEAEPVTSSILSG